MRRIANYYDFGTGGEAPYGGAGGARFCCRCFRSYQIGHTLAATAWFEKAGIGEKRDEGFIALNNEIDCSAFVSACRAGSLLGPSHGLGSQCAVSTSRKEFSGSERRQPRRLSLATPGRQRTRSRVGSWLPNDWRRLYGYSRDKAAGLVKRWIHRVSRILL